MRVVGGVCRGRRLFHFKGRSIRPTTDRVREAIFDTLSALFHHTLEPSAVAFDLFAGSGALGIEALSRGTGRVVFVEREREALDVIRKNLEICGLVDRALILPVDVKRGLSILSQRGEVADLIFLDPPYGRGLVEDTLKAIGEKGLLKGGGVVVAEHSKKELPCPVPPLRLAKRAGYGDTVVSYYVGEGYGEDSRLPGDL